MSLQLACLDRRKARLSVPPVRTQAGKTYWESNEFTKIENNYSRVGGRAAAGQGRIWGLGLGDSVSQQVQRPPSTPASRRQPTPLPPGAVSPGLPEGSVPVQLPGAQREEPGRLPSFRAPWPAACGWCGRARERSTVGWELRSQVSCRRRPRWPAGGQREGSARSQALRLLHGLGARLSSKWSLCSAFSLWSQRRGTRCRSVHLRPVRPGPLLTSLSAPSSSGAPEKPPGHRHK